MVHVFCKCGKGYKVPNSRAGRIIRCPNCLRKMPVPTTDEVLAHNMTWRIHRIKKARRAIWNGRAALICSFFSVAWFLVYFWLTWPPELRSDHECLAFFYWVASILAGFTAGVVGRGSCIKTHPKLGSARRMGTWGIAVGIITATFAFVFPAGLGVIAAAKRMQVSNNLKHILIAMHYHNDTQGQLLPAAIYDMEGKTPLLSWRVAILPYLDETDLYNQFKLDEPWDSPANKPLIEKMPQCYAHPKRSPFFTRPSGFTHFRVFVSNDPNRPDLTAFPNAPKGMSLSAIKDGLANTILVVEAAEAVPWTKPDELSYSTTGIIPPIGIRKNRDDGVQIGLADGSVIFLSNDELTESRLRKLIEPNDGAQVVLP